MGVADSRVNDVDIGEGDVGVDAGEGGVGVDVGEGDGTSADMEGVVVDQFAIPRVDLTEILRKFPPQTG